MNALTEAGGAPAEKKNVVPSDEFVDAELAMLLSRLAALQGYAVPVHRFGMMATTKSGNKVENMSRTLRATEWWLSAVPSGSVHHLEGEAGRADMPALWIATDGSQVMLLKGLLNHGGFSCELADGKTVEISAEAALDGHILRLQTQLAAGNVASNEPKTARDWFFFAIRKRFSVFTESIVATAIMSVLALTASMYTMQVYDRVVPTQGYSTLIVLTIGTVLAMLLELMMKQVRTHMVDKACKEIDQELSGVFFGHVLAIRMEARPKTIGTFAAQIRQFETVRNFMTSSTLFLLADLPFVVFFLLVIGSIGGMVAIIPLALLPISLAVGFYARWKLANAAEEQIKSSNQKNGVLIEAIDGIEAIKAVGGEWKLLDQWRHLTASAAEHEMTTRNTAMTATNVSQTLQQLSYALMIGFGAYLITIGQITQGSLMACSIISNRALGPISQIAGMIVQWQHARVALKGLDDMMALPTDRGSGERQVIPATCKGHIGLEGVSLSYNPAVVALQATNLKIRPGERIAVLGPVGSGKSTLIKILSGLYKPNEGRAFLDDVDMMHLAPEFVREHIGYLTQDVRLFSGTLRDNLIMGLPSPTDEQILFAASKTGLEQIVKSHPAGFGLPIMEGGRGLSGGQRQVVGLTRLLLARPRILLLDEPTASMDGDLEAMIMRNLFTNMPSDSVILLATHKRSLISLVDRVIIMDKGRILLDGPREEVLAKLASAAAARNAKPQQIGGVA